MGKYSEMTVASIWSTLVSGSYSRYTWTGSPTHRSLHISSDRETLLLGVSQTTMLCSLVRVPAGLSQDSVRIWSREHGVFLTNGEKGGTSEYFPRALADRLYESADPPRSLVLVSQTPGIG